MCRLVLHEGLQELWVHLRVGGEGAGHHSVMGPKVSLTHGASCLKAEVLGLLGVGWWRLLLGIEILKKLHLGKGLLFLLRGIRGRVGTRRGLSENMAVHLVPKRQLERLQGQLARRLLGCMEGVHWSLGSPQLHLCLLGHHLLYGIVVGIHRQDPLLLASFQGFRVTIEARDRNPRVRSPFLATIYRKCVVPQRVRRLGLLLPACIPTPVRHPAHH